jgi:hypothetical protein
MSRRLNRRRIAEMAEVISDLRSLGAVDLDPPRKRYGFEQRLERADRRPRADDRDEW